MGLLCSLENTNRAGLAFRARLTEGRAEIELALVQQLPARPGCGSACYVGVLSEVSIQDAG